MEMRFRLATALVAVTLLVPAVTYGDEVAGGQRQRAQPCPGDLDFDYDIDLADLAVLLAAYDTCVGDTFYNPVADLDDSGCVDLADLSSLLAVYGTTCPLGTELAGNSLDQYPFFEYVRAFNEDATVEVAIDPTRFPEIVGRTGDIYVVATKTAAQWSADPSLVDVTSGGPQTETFGGTTIQENTFGVTGPHELDADAGIGLGVGYDVVLDLNQNGTLDADDIIDGLGDEAGLYAVHDTTQRGPLAIVATIYHEPTGYCRLTYPADIAPLGQRPLVVIAPGLGGHYTWYDHVGFHLASYGYIVVCHAEGTIGGIEVGATKTLGSTDYFIGNQGTIAGGVLDGHIDSHRIVWMGHSRGGEAIVRAYDRLFDGDDVPQNYGVDDIVLLSSMAPMDFLGRTMSNPHGANYHVWVGSADAYVTGIPGMALGQLFTMYERATGSRQSTIMQGHGHGDFWTTGSAEARGPCLIGRPNAHAIQKGYVLPLVKHYTEGNIPAIDFLSRQWESFKPIGAPSGPICPESGGDSIVVTNTYHNGASIGDFVIDNYQAEFETTVNSSGGTVTFDVSNVFEGVMRDTDRTFDWTPGDPMNGMILARANDDARGVVFDWEGSDQFYEQEIVPEQRDISRHDYLSFRACQGTRHPHTIVEIADLTFSVTLRDGSATSSSINIAAYGGGIEEPYQRVGAGTGVGWFNEFETIRIRLTDFLTNGSALDLTDIVALRFDFGPSFGSNEGRLGLDDIELTSDPMPE
jgi:hypothetical protein